MTPAHSPLWSADRGWRSRAELPMNPSMRALLLLLLLAGCATPMGRGPSAIEAMRRLPPLVGTFARVPVTAAMGANDDARQVAGTAYRQIAGTAVVTVVVPNTPDPAAADGIGGAGMAQAMERAILRARLRAAGEGGVLTVRHQLVARQNNEPLLRCWVVEVALPVGPAPAGRLRTECVGVVVDRFISLAGTMADTPAEMQAVLSLGMQLVQVLRDPNAPAVTDLRPVPVQPDAVPTPTPAPDAVPTPPGTRRGRGYSL